MAVVLAGCGPASILFTFENRTDAALCYYLSRGDAELAECNQELGPRDETKWGTDCDNRNNRRIQVMVTVKQDGREIYDRPATCGEWNDTDRRFIIEQEGDEFIVTDSLPDE
ncbi:MAG: hypothetical protein WEE64_14090 [Dehalococcoidia bacterium]